MNGYHPFEIEHPLLGRLAGTRRNDQVIQFRSIPFGFIPRRFRQAVLVEQLSSKQRVCTEYSYACPQEEQSMDAFGGPLPDEKPRQYDELSCLNLTVTAPASLLSPGCTRKVPVLVYCHGGGFTVGAHFGGLHDMTRTVTMACDESNPVIIVSIHYRLHFLGFLASQELLDEAVRNNEMPCNYALHDQRLAFRWVHRYIAGFGGDTSQITAFGESAGSASLCFHMSSDVPLFNRAILQSGTASAISPETLDRKEDEYRRLLRHLGISPSDPERLEKLRNVPSQTLVEAAKSITQGAFSPLAHDSFFPVVPDYLNQADIIASCPWVDSVITGDAVYEGYLFAWSLKTVRPADFCQHVAATLGSSRASRVLGLYEISADMDPNLFWTKLCLFTGDVMFSLPCHKLSKALAQSNKDTYRCTLSLRNPFSGSFFSGVLGHHFIELLYVFMTLLERFPQQVQRDISVGFAKRWIDFTNGKAPWRSYSWADQSIAVADSREGWVVRTRKEDSERSVIDEGGQRRYEKWEALDVVFCELGDGAPAAVAALSFPVLVTLAKTEGTA